MIVWEILVPRKWNDGTEITIEHHREWDKKVRDIAGGLTIMPPTIKGEWISPDGQLFIDSTIPVRIGCTKKQMEDILFFTTEHYKQEAVMAYKISDTVMICRDTTRKKRRG